LRPAPERDDATLAITTWLALQPVPVWGVRVHDVRGTRDALAVLDRLTGSVVERDLPVVERDLPVVERDLPVVERDLPVVERSRDQEERE
jgi:hypothetical protein